MRIHTPRHRSSATNLLYTCATAFSVYALSLLSTTSAALAADHPVAQHVHLKGLSFDGPATQVLETVTHMCQQMGTPPEPLPAGDHPFELSQDRYYTPGGVTIYETQQFYLVVSPGCKLTRKIETKVKVHHAHGTCSVEPDRKRAVGACDLTVSNLMTAASQRPRGAGTIGSGGVVAGEKVIAGHHCKVVDEQYSGLSWRSCVAQGGQLAQMGEPGRANRGIVLKDEGWMTGRENQLLINLEATEVETDVAVTPLVLLPYLAPDYKVINVPGRARAEK